MPVRRRKPGGKGPGVTLADLIGDGLLKAGVRLFCEYKGQTLEATLLADGDVKYEGRQYSSPSAAGAAARQTVTGRQMSTNGWKFWQVEVEGGAQTLRHIREAYRKGKG